MASNKIITLYYYLYTIFLKPVPEGSKIIYDRNGGEGNMAYYANVEKHDMFSSFVLTMSYTKSTQNCNSERSK